MNAIFIIVRLQSKDNFINWNLLEKFSKLDNVKFFLSLSFDCLDLEVFNEVIKKLNVSLDCIHIEAVKVPSFIYKLNKRPETSFQNCYKQFYHNKKNIENIIRYETTYNIRFDKIVKFRLDLKHYGDINLTPPKENTVYIPNCYDYCGVNDQIAFGDSNTMRRYCLLVNFVFEYCNQNNVIYNPEILLKYHLEERKINIERFNFVYELF